MVTERVRLGDVLELERIPAELDPGTEYVQIGIRSFGRGIFHRDPCHAVELSKLRYFQVNPGRLIISNIMAWEGAIGLSGETERGCIGSNRFLSYKAVGEVDLSYLNYYFQSTAGRETIRSASTGTVTRNQTLSIHDFENLHVPLPSLTEQRRIASKLNPALDRVAMVESLRRRVADLYLQFRDGLIREAGSSHGHVVRIGDILQLERLAIDVDPDSTYSQIGIKSFGKGIFHREPCLGSELAKLRYFRVQPNRLIVSNIMAWEGAIAASGEAEEGCVGSSRFLSFLPIQPVDLRYLHHFFQTSLGMELVRGASTGTVTRNQTLSIETFESLRVPLPDSPKQTTIAGMLDSLADRIRVAHSANTMESLKAAMLYSAFSGRL